MAYRSWFIANFVYDERLAIRDVRFGVRRPEKDKSIRRRLLIFSGFSLPICHWWYQV